MNKRMITGVSCLILLLSLAGFCIADEAPGYTLYIQGGEFSIIKDADGVILMTIQEVIPYVLLDLEKAKELLPVSDASIFSLPLNAALIFSGTDGNSVSLVQISNLTLSDENNTLTLQIKPLEFYEGEMLKAYATDAIDIANLDKEMKKTIGIYLEGSLPTRENWDPAPCHNFKQCWGGDDD